MLAVSAIEAVTDVVTAADFYRQSHGLIFQAIIDMYSNGISADPITVADLCEERGFLAKMGGKERIREIATLVPTSSNSAHHARIVREMAILRSLVTVGSQITALGRERPDEANELIGQAEALIFDLSHDRPKTEFVSTRTVAPEAFQRLEDLAHRKGTVGVPTGYREIDKMTSGLHPGNLIIVAGRPGTGKSAYSLGMAAHCVLHLDPPIPVALFTMEMSRLEVIDRLYASEGFVPSDRLQTPANLVSDDWEKLANLTNRLTNAPMFIEDTGGGASMIDVRSKARRLKLRNPDLGLIIIDYLQLMNSGTTSESRQNEVSQISRALKMLAGELQLPIVALSQLSRDVEKRHDKRPILADIRESGSVEQDADVVMFVYRESYYFPDDEECRGIAEINIAKHRNGPTGIRRLSFVDRFIRFGDLAPEGMAAQ